MDFSLLKNNLMKTLDKAVTQKLSPTAKLKLFGLAQIPLLFMVNPKVLKVDNESCDLYVPLNYVTQNHLKSMYFGALAIGADAVVAILALNVAEQYKDKATMVPVFKNLTVDFLKRAETGVVFRCEQGAKINGMVQEALAKNERVTAPIDVVAFSKKNPEEIFARFTLGLSLKAKLKV
ncbi:MAG: DUF4442 domain-containing protein [Bdellovibrionota bacterium]